MARSPYSELPYPLGGVSVEMGYQHQDNSQGVTCVDALNSRGYDPATNRLRGAQRCGLSKYVTGQLSGTHFIQCIDHLMTSAAQTASSGNSVRALLGVAVSNGTVKSFTRAGFNNTTNGAGALDATTVYMNSAPLFNRIYFADGKNWKYWDAPTDTVNTWSATAGSLPTDSFGNLPRLICQWRGRIVLSGILGDPQNWFMSRQFVATDFDYGTAPNIADAQQAFAGNNTEAGYCPDIVTCLISYSDDLLIMGGDHSMWQVTEDPAAGGQIDRISDTVGMAFGTPWCKDNVGAIYFFGSRGGFYRMQPSTGGTAAPERISGQRIDNLLQSVDLSKNIVKMVWDDKFQCVMFFITPTDGTTATFNWCYDVRNNAFWKDQFTNPLHNPTAVHLMDGDDPTDRVVLLGGQDGYIRFIDNASKTDDGTAISSYVYFGPIQTDSGRFKLKELRCILAETSDQATLELFRGHSAEYAYNQPEAHFAVTLDKGRSRAIRIGGAAQAMYLKLSNSTPNTAWSFEQMFAWLEGEGQAAGRWQ